VDSATTVALTAGFFVLSSTAHQPFSYGTRGLNMNACSNDSFVQSLFQEETLLEALAIYLFSYISNYQNNKNMYDTYFFALLILSS